MQDLIAWKNREDRKPLILLGARQVGKTYILKEFGQREFEKVAYINCDNNAMAKDLFASDYNIDRILLTIGAITGVNIEAGNTLIIMDEFPEFTRQVLEVMRQPLEDRHISVARARYSIDYPASFMLVASMNPCPCGYYNHPTKQCTCAPGQVRRYLSRISDPLLDRIDIQIEILPVPFERLSSAEAAESSAAIRRRVIAARAIQQARFADEPDVNCNAQMNSRLIKQWCRLSEETLTILRQAMTKFDMSARAYDRIIKVARTIADLDPTNTAADPAFPISPIHMREAVNYRNLDRASWGATY